MQTLFQEKGSGPFSTGRAGVSVLFQSVVGLEQLPNIYAVNRRACEDSRP
jgi:hypothetical protein